MNNLGLFLQDAWTIGKRLTLNLGLRTENEHVPSFSRDPRIPKTAIHFGFGDKLAPRVGFAWDATGDGQDQALRLLGRLLRHHEAAAVARRFGGMNGNLSWYTLDTGDIGAIVDNPACPPAARAA